MIIKNQVKSILLVGVLLTLFVASSFAVNPIKTDAAEPFFTLIAKTNSGGDRPDVLNFLRQHLARICINLEVIIQDWPTFVNELLTFRNFDICYIWFTGGDYGLDFYDAYSENATLNLFGYHTGMDWDDELGTGKNEWYLKQGALMIPPNSEERVQHYWEWEDYLMDKLCPLLPTFTPREYTATWSNLNGYTMSAGVLQSWGHMQWEGTHTGQVSTDEVVITDTTSWFNLNPFFQLNLASMFINDAIMDPLIWYDADMSVWPHLAKRFEYIGDTTIEIEVRQGIKWSQDPEGLFPNEYLDIYDVYFTLYVWKNIIDAPLWHWITNMEILDDWTMRISVDGNEDLLGAQPYVSSLQELSIHILPEHYLNQTQELDGETPDLTHASWSTFATSAFGTGLFNIADFQEGVETVLTLRQDCWRLNTTITSDQALKWERRFGFTPAWEGPQQLRVKIIPNQRMALCEFEEGKIDIFGITPFTIQRDAYYLDPSKEVQEDISFSQGFFAFNMREDRGIIGNPNPLPSDPSMSVGLAIRKAISYACDRNEINQVIHREEHFITHWPIPPKMGIWCNPNIIRYDYNLSEARKLMFIPVPPTTTTTTLGLTAIIPLFTIFAVTNVLFLFTNKRK